MPLRRKLLWVSVLYFAEGLPFGIAADHLPVYFRRHQLPLEEIGMLTLLGLPWTLKVMWAPLVDRYGERRQWIAASLIVIAASLALVPLGDPAAPPWWLWALLLTCTTAAATQDIAIDAYTIGLLGPREEGVANGFRVSAYRAALVVAGGGLVMAAPTIGWAATFRIAAAVALLLAIVAARAPSPQAGDADSRGIDQTAGRSAESNWWSPVVDWLRRPGAPAVFAFVLLYKLGDSAMGPMIKPFWVDRQLTPVEIGLVSTTFGVAASVVGALAGGVLTTRWGIYLALWILGAAQALSNLGYAAVAWYDGGREAIYAASILESFTGGLGTAAFLAFLMHICDKGRAATEYALLSAVFALTRLLAGPLSGWGAANLGYAPYFALTFLAALPAYALLPAIRSWIRDSVDG